MSEMGRRSPLRRQSEPGGESRLYLKLLSPRVGQTIHAVALNDRIEGVLTHWYDEQTHPCLAEVGDCDGCRDHRKARWKGFLPAMLHPSGVRVLLEITRGAWESCSILKTPEPSLRGRLVKVYRRGSSKRSPVIMEVGSMATGLVLPAQVDVIEVLERLWGLNADRPARVVGTDPDSVPMP